MGRQSITENWQALRRRRVLGTALPDDDGMTVDLTEPTPDPDDEAINLPTWLRLTPTSRKRPLFERWRE